MYDIHLFEKYFWKGGKNHWVVISQTTAVEKIPHFSYPQMLAFTTPAWLALKGEFKLSREKTPNVRLDPFSLSQIH